MGQSRPLFNLLSVCSNKQYFFYKKSMWKNVHPVFGTKIQTHNLLNMIRHPLPLDQCSRPSRKQTYLVLWKQLVWLAKSLSLSIDFVWFDWTQFFSIKINSNEVWDLRKKILSKFFTKANTTNFYKSSNHAAFWQTT